MRGARQFCRAFLLSSAAVLALKMVGEGGFFGWTKGFLWVRKGVSWKKARVVFKKVMRGFKNFHAWFF